MEQSVLQPHHWFKAEQVEGGSRPVGAGQCGYPPSTSVVCTGHLNYCGCPEHAFNCWNRSQFLITAPLTKDSLDHWKGLSIDWTLEFLFEPTPPLPTFSLSILHRQLTILTRTTKLYKRALSQFQYNLDMNFTIFYSPLHLTASQVPSPHTQSEQIGSYTRTNKTNPA